MPVLHSKRSKTGSAFEEQASESVYETYTGHALHCSVVATQMVAALPLACA